MVNRTNSLLVTTLILGLLSILAFFTGWHFAIGLILGIAGIVIGIPLRKRLPSYHRYRSLATVGIWSSLAGILLALYAIGFITCVDGNLATGF